MIPSNTKELVFLRWTCFNFPIFSFVLISMLYKFYYLNLYVQTALNVFSYIINTKLLKINLTDISEIKEMSASVRYHYATAVFDVSDSILGSD